MSEDGYEVWTEAGDFDERLPRIVGTDLGLVLDRGVDRGDPTSLGQPCERAVRTFAASVSGPGYVPGQRAVWWHDRLTGVLSAALADA